MVNENAALVVTPEEKAVTDLVLSNIKDAEAAASAASATAASTRSEAKG